MQNMTNFTRTRVYGEEFVDSMKPNRCVMMSSLYVFRLVHQAGCPNKSHFFDRDGFGLYVNNDCFNGKPSGIEVEAGG